MYTLPGYSLEYTNRDFGRGGGVCLYSKSNIQVNKIPELSFCKKGFMESVVLELTYRKVKHIVACVYRPPSTNVHLFNEQFVPFISELSQLKGDVYVCGDFNIDILRYDTHSESKNFVDLMFSMGFMPKLNKPTRITLDSAKSIDNV